jgi:pyruvate/2-oxoglutarate dehydrogenase complex dihydrolipoamide dehydrogenase (E3) component
MLKTNENPVDAMLTSGKNISYWTDSSGPEIVQPLNENLTTEIVIIGGGIAGVSIAYCLTQAGRRVILLEEPLPIWSLRSMTGIIISKKYLGKRKQN